MKFTKNELSEALKAKLTNNGKKHLSMSERTFNSMVEKIYKRLDKRESEDELNDTVEDYIEDFEEVDGDFRSRDSKHAKEKKEWEEKNSPRTEGKDDDDESDEKVPAWAKKLIEENKQMKAKLDQEDENRAIKNKKADLYKILKEKGVTKEYLDDYDEDIHITTDTDIDAMAEKWEKRYNKYKSSSEESHTPGSAGNGKTEEADYSDIIRLRKQAMHIQD